MYFAKLSGTVVLLEMMQPVLCSVVSLTVAVLVDIRPDLKQDVFMLKNLLILYLSVSRRHPQIEIRRNHLPNIGND